MTESPSFADEGVDDIPLERDPELDRASAGNSLRTIERQASDERSTA
jgi:hypothetical protein